MEIDFKIKPIMASITDEKVEVFWTNMVDINLSKYDVSTEGRVRKSKTLTLLTNTPSADGYCHINLTMDDGSHPKCAVHRLVAIIYIENPDNKPTVHHINYKRNDNRVENLTWATRSEQSRDKAPENKNKKKGRAIFQFSLDYKFINRHKGTTEASLVNKIDENVLIKACLKRSSLLGFFWIYCDDKEKLPNEEFKSVAVPELKDNYEISNYGRVFSKKINKIMRGYVNANKYAFADITDTNGNKQKWMIHRLEMITFNGESDLQVNHKDGNKLNNCLYNLEYVTPSQNVKHAHDNGLISGERKSIPVVQFSLDGIKIKEYKSISEASNETNTCNSTITRCCNHEGIKGGKYIWLYKYDENSISKMVEKLKEYNKRNAMVIQYAKDGLTEIARFKSIGEAHRITKIGEKGISQCIRGITSSGCIKLTHDGFVWKRQII